ncbi:MAG: type II toxin-antitoxin system VapC family toxin [Candidatus Thermoplasmatota archaeon]|nr:type II toxin-antitoxin system VapC family toxin [Candidatus Thermoplasmatota archaeon]
MYVDANYWIYWFDERFPEHIYVNESMQSAIRGGVVLSTVTLMEVAHYFRILPVNVLEEKIEMITSLSTLTLVDFTYTILQSSISFLSKYSISGLGGRDCVILATMKAAGSKVLLTHDKAFKKVRGIKIIDEIS